VCVMRDPIDWLHSWYRYRKRDALKGRENSTENIDFSEFVTKYISGDIRVGKQSTFVMGKNGEIGVDKIFKYDNLNKLKEYFEDKIGKIIEFPMLNVSPKEDLLIDKGLESMLKDYLEKDYLIYNSID